MALAVSLSKASYLPGEAMVLTVRTTPAERDRDVPIAVHVDVDGLGSTDLVGRLDLPPAAVTVTDPSRTWALTSDDGATAVFSAVA